jgi:hypothetical protein
LASTPPLPEPQPTFNPLPALAGWLVPGLGHALLGQRRRGFIIGLAILLLWLAGLLVGGIVSIDRVGNPWWFVPQAVIAPSIAVDYLATWAQPDRSPLPNHTAPPPPPPQALPLFAAVYGRMAEQGVLYTALAGLLNLLAILDVVYCDPQRRRGGAAIPRAAERPGEAP